jgi:hypothetical protein
MFIILPPKTFESPYNIRSEVCCLRVFAALQFLESSGKFVRKPFRHIIADKGSGLLRCSLRVGKTVL